jgi:mannose-6-phosphate isomerase-like protein (cupin superfamily)
MRIGSYSSGTYVPATGLGGAGTVHAFDALDRSDFQTPIEFIKRGRLDPGVSVGLHRHERSEECLLLLDGPLTVAHNDHSAVVEPAAVALCPAGNAHGVFNHSDRPASFIGIGVAPEDGPFDRVELGDDLTERQPGDPSLLLVERLDTALLGPFKAHLGLGEIRFRRLFDHTAFSTNWGFVDHALVPPGTSVGYHRHDAVQECYVIIAGTGLIKVDGEVAEVSVGDCIPNRIGGSHGLVNHREAPLEFLNVGVFLHKGQFDATDLGDDLGDLL